MFPIGQNGKYYRNKENDNKKQKYGVSNASNLKLFSLKNGELLMESNGILKVGVDISNGIDFSCNSYRCTHCNNIIFTETFEPMRCDDILANFKPKHFEKCPICNVIFKQRIIQK